MNTMSEPEPGDSVTVVAGSRDGVSEYRSPLPRLTTRVFWDLAIWMTGLGLLVGLLFPFFVVALGVPTKYALTARFFLATSVAGLIVGVANHLLSRSVVGSRLRFMRMKMATVESLLYQSARSDAEVQCTPEECAIKVDSDDELGAVLSSFNRLVAAQAASHRANDLSARFASILSSHIEVVPLTDEALAHLQEACGAQASALCIGRHSALETIASNGMVWLKGPAGSVTVHNCCMVHGSLPNGSPRPRPLPLQTYSAVESYPVAGIGANGVTGRASGAIIGGSATQLLEVDGRQLHGAPDWSKQGPPTIFGSQQKDR